MFLDRHDAIDATPEDVAAAHLRDMEVEGAYGVKYYTYWFDRDNRTVFCLCEGPDREAVEAVHREAHGLMATAVIEIDSNAPLNAMLAPMPQHAPGTAYTASAVRAIVFTDICGSVAQTHELGDDGHMLVLREHNEIVRSRLAEHDGREVKHTGDGIMAAFSSVAAAVAFASEVQRALDVRNASAGSPLHVSIGISAGEPLTDESDDLFGAAVQLAARLCAAAEPGEIAVSLAVRELCIGKPFVFADRGTATLKGLPQPVQIFCVTWR
jgi:class 3 adenylate cyclase